ncbi:hypothetical protein DSAG12_02951 [Promethearchaeum syntrophicum]|uniref:Uncharacterized protein n=1 Tax=Promethearchaeum syntrophicum TaxID=2594042 RepID=A0A5B9DCT9_9ARCH|nr:hypothetical protein [Candidatus Prometheoarchaeum syntrophicum]QEE17119.1 hypothetical protein DSAG12_02951 [Candidatus Prometheoarchaeum syntrophicum]
MKNKIVPKAPGGIYDNAVEKPNKTNYSHPISKGKPNEGYKHANHFIQEDEGIKLGLKVVSFCQNNPIN